MAVAIPQARNSFRFALSAVTEVRVVDARKMDTVAAVHEVGTRYRSVCYPVPTPGATGHLAGEPQPDRTAVLASGVLGVVVWTFALIHLPALHQ